MSPSFSPCLLSGKHSRRLFQNAIEDCKINGQALVVALQHRLGWSDYEAQTALSKSAAVASGCHLLGQGKRATALAIVTQFESQKGLIQVFHACKFWALKTEFSMKHAGSCYQAKQQSLFAQSFYH